MNHCYHGQTQIGHDLPLSVAPSTLFRPINEGPSSTPSPHCYTFTNVGIKSLQQDVNSLILSSDTQDMPASTSTAAPESPQQVGTANTKYSVVEALLLTAELHRYICEHVEAHGRGPTSFPAKFQIPVDSTMPSTFNGDEIRTGQQLADVLIASMAHYVRNVSTEQDNNSADNGLTEAVKTDVTGSPTEVPTGLKPEASGQVRPAADSVQE